MNIIVVYITVETTTIYIVFFFNSLCLVRLRLQIILHINDLNVAIQIEKKNITRYNIFRES